jgi:hypothetical protein
MLDVVCAKERDPYVEGVSTKGLAGIHDFRKGQTSIQRHADQGALSVRVHVLPIPVMV